MTPLSSSSLEASAALTADPLVALQLRVTRRADELAATRTARTAINLACWLQAEQEILHSQRSDDAPAFSPEGRPSATR